MVSASNGIRDDGVQVIQADARALTTPLVAAVAQGAAACQTAQLLVDTRILGTDWKAWRFTFTAHEVIPKLVSHLCCGTDDPHCGTSWNNGPTLFHLDIVTVFLILRRKEGRGKIHRCPYHSFCQHRLLCSMLGCPSCC